jgi:hypothetical protein
MPSHEEDAPSCQTKVGLSRVRLPVAHGLPVRVPLMGRMGTGTLGGAGTSPWQLPAPSQLKLVKHASVFVHAEPFVSGWHVCEMTLHWLHGPQLPNVHLAPVS